MAARFGRLFLFDAFDILKLEAIFLFNIWVFLVVDFAKKHGFWARPELAFAVKLTIEHKLFFSFGILCDVYDDVVIALEMFVNTIDDKFIHAEFLRRRVAGFLA